MIFDTERHTIVTIKYKKQEVKEQQLIRISDKKHNY